MAQPTAYTPTTDFSDEAASNAAGRSTVNPTKLDTEFANLNLTLDETLTNLALIQRDDGKIRDGKVELHTLSAQVKALFATAGATIRGDWVTATSYAVRDVVTESGATYICATAHTSGTFSTDLAADKWVIIANAPDTFTAADITNTPAGSIAATNVQDAINELDGDIATVAAAVLAIEEVPLAGGTMTGPLVLSGDPTAALGAVPKQYADAIPAGRLAGHCRLEYVSSSQIKLMPFNGNKLFINGEWLAIPAAGVTLSNTGLTAATVYRIYAYKSGSSIALEASTTARATDATYGHEIKNGDATRTLVGIVYMGAGTPGTFVDSATQRFVRSWFNRGRRSTMQNALAAGASIGYSPWQQLSTSARVEFVAFSDDQVTAEAGMTAYDSGGATCQFYAAIGFDSTSVPTGANASVTVPAANKIVNVTAGGSPASLSEGYHYATLLTGIAAGTTPLVLSGGNYAWIKAELMPA